MDFETFSRLVAEAAAAAGITDHELYYQTVEGTSVSAVNHEVNEFSSALEGGVCLRCLVNGHMGYASTQALNAEEAAALVRRAAAAAAALESTEPEFLVEGGQTYRSLPRTQPALPAAGELVKLALDGQAALYAADPRVVDGSETEAFGQRVHIAITNSRGLAVRYENTVCGFVAAAVVTDGTEKANAYKVKIAPPAKVDLAGAAAEAAAEAAAKMGAGVAPTGAMPVVFSPKAMGQLLATYAGVFSAENAIRGLSLLKDKEGQTIASEAVTLVDDPFYAHSHSPMPFDAEGSPTACKNVIEGGVLRTLLYNLRTAAACGRATTGNAAKAGYDAPVTVRPFTLYVAPGPHSEEELLRQAGKGVYIDFLGGLHAGANTISGDFSLQSAGFLIEDGRKGAPVRAFTVAGNFFGLLRGVAAVADRLEPPTSSGATAFLSPAVLVQGLSIAGK